MSNGDEVRLFVMPAVLPHAELVRRLVHLLETGTRDGKAAPCDTPGTSGRPALERLLVGHEPFAACAMDADWNLIAANDMARLLIGPVAPLLLIPPVNVLRLVLHPEGLAPRLANLAEVRGHLVRRLRRRISLTGSESLIRLDRELAGYAHTPDTAAPGDDADPIVIPVRLWVGSTLLNLTSAAVFFGTPWSGSADETIGELLFPADRATRELLFTWPDGQTVPG